jgi:hypothetical protein
LKLAPGKNARLYLKDIAKKQKKKKKQKNRLAGGQVVEHLPGKCEALSSSPFPLKKNHFGILYKFDILL